jgi:20S proteasome alpha/beta subunit
LTVLVGIYCTDGIVIGADSAATNSAGSMSTVEQPIEKIDIVDGRLLVAGTGSVGLGQRFVSAVDKLNANKSFSGKSAIDIGKQLCNAGISDFSQTNVAKGSYGALVAYLAADKKCHLCELDLMSFQPELKTERLWYVSMGSGQMIVDPFLALMRRAFWTKGPPTVADGIFATTWAIQHAIETNPGGVNGPIRIATLQVASGTSPPARMLSEDEISVHMENVESAVRHLGDYKRISTNAATNVSLPNL